MIICNLYLLKIVAINMSQKPMIPNNKVIELVHLDDHKIFQNGVKNTLNATGIKYLFTGFEHSDDALEHIENSFRIGRKTDVILTDFTHLGHDVFVFSLWAKTIAAHYSTHIPIILLTMHRPEYNNYIIQGIDEGIFDCYLSKASNSSEIAAAINNELKFANAINNFSSSRNSILNPVLEFEDQMRYVINSRRRIKIYGVSNFTIFHNGEITHYSDKNNSIVFDFGRKILNISGYVSEEWFNNITDFYISDVKSTEDHLKLLISNLKEIPATKELVIIGNTIELENINRKWKCSFAIYNHSPIKIENSYFI